HPAPGGYVLGYQHIFWFYSHPAVYIMMLPGFGIISEVISVFSRKPIFGYRLMALSLLAILVLGFSVWAHHMFVSGMASYLRVPMMITTLLIAVPTGIKIFSWLATLWEGKLHFWLTFVFFNLTFFPMHLIGSQGMPRRVADYIPRFADWNLFISISAFALGASFIIFFYNMIHSWRYGPIAPGNPWRALTLEWQVSSPPPIFNFDEIPQVVGGPYEYGVPGARHAVFNGDRAPQLEEVHH